MSTKSSKTSRGKETVRGRKKAKNQLSLPPPQIVLASASLARRELMKKLRKPFTWCVSDFDEDMLSHGHPRKLATHLALGKALTAAKQKTTTQKPTGTKASTPKWLNAIIIGADTFIMVGTKKIGKPKNIKEAQQIIGSMSGKTIRVYTGLAILKTDINGKIITKRTSCVLTKLKIKKMTQAEIDLLTHAPEALKISGAFSIEGSGGKMIKKIDGDYDNVIGLPMFKVKEMLKNI